MIQKPYDINLQGKTIDANENNILSWKSSGDISTAFSVSIYMNDNDSLAWSLGKTNSLACEYVIPENDIENCYEYKVCVTVYNKGKESATSDYVVFHTSARPVVTIAPIGTAGSQSYAFEAVYNQADSVPMRSYIALLYDVYGTLIATSGIQTTEPMRFIYSGLQSDKSYYIEFQAVSEKGLTGTSGRVPFDVLYAQPTIDSGILAENHDNASVKLMWNVVQIHGRGESYTFKDGTKVDVKNGYVCFDDGVNISGDFTIKLWAEDVIPEQNLLSITGKDGYFHLIYGSDKRFHFYKEQYGYKTHVGSHLVKGERFYVCMQQVGRFINLYVEGL